MRRFAPLSPAASLLLALLLVAFVGVAGCRSPRSLEGTWTLESIDATAGSPPLPAPGRTTPRITFDAPNQKGEGKVTGFGGVNRFFGNYTVGSGTIAFGALGATRMAGPNELMLLEKILIGVIQKSMEWKVEKDSLLLSGTAGSATFARAEESK